MSPSTEAEDRYDVVIVGGGPAGCSAGVFCARYGLDTVIFDRGRSSLKRCAYLENYLGFPAGIDVETFYELMHAHVEKVGCDLVPELVERVERSTTGFDVETQEGRTVETERVVAAAAYDAQYLRPLGVEGVMFETREHDGEKIEVFDETYPDEGGRTPIDGLYVAGPLADEKNQAIIAAGHGATVGRNVIADVRREQGYWDEVAESRDWVRQWEELDEEWTDRQRWQEWFDERVPEDLDRSEKTVDRIREEVIDRKLSSYIFDTDIESRTERGQRRLAETLDEDILLDTLDEERMRAYLDQKGVTVGDD